MPFSSGIKRFGALCVMVMLVACETADRKDTAPAPQTEAPVSAGGQDFVLIPDPYQPGPVPDAAKREYQRIKSLMQAQKWSQAKGLLELMVETYPNLAGPYTNLGIVHHKLGEHEAAEKALQFAIETNPQNLDAYTRLGLLYRETGRFDEAEAVYLNALKVWPHHLPSATNLGILYDLYMGRFEDALVYYELSQKILGGEDRQLKGWIVDLKRRMEAQ